MLPRIQSPATTRVERPVTFQPMKPVLRSSALLPLHRWCSIRTKLCMSLHLTHCRAKLGESSTITSPAPDTRRPVDAAAKKPAEERTPEDRLALAAPQQVVRYLAIRRTWYNHTINALIDKTVCTVKADAARRARRLSSTRTTGGNTARALGTSRGNSHNSRWSCCLEFSPSTSI